jgi:hypothetical protein
MSVTPSSSQVERGSADTTTPLAFDTAALMN